MLGSLVEILETDEEDESDRANTEVVGGETLVEGERTCTHTDHGQHQSRSEKLDRISSLP